MRVAKELGKTTVRIWAPLRKRFDDVLTRNGLKRDAYLNFVLGVEIRALDTEVQKNSEEARQHIVRGLNRLKDRQLVTLALRKDLMRQLDAICDNKRICRDAFFNRLLFLLTASPQTLDLIFFEGDNSWRADVWSECKHDGPFFRNVFYPLDQEVNPFWAIRAGLALWNQERRKARVETLDGIYRASFWKLGEKGEYQNLIGLSCCLPDSAVRGTQEYKEFEVQFAALLGRSAAVGKAK